MKQIPVADNGKQQLDSALLSTFCLCLIKVE